MEESGSADLDYRVLPAQKLPEYKNQSPVSQPPPSQSRHESTSQSRPSMATPIREPIGGRDGWLARWQRRHEVPLTDITVQALAKKLSDRSQPYSEGGINRPINRSELRKLFGYRSDVPNSDVDIAIGNAVNGLYHTGALATDPNFRPNPDSPEAPGVVVINKQALAAAMRPIEQARPQTEPTKPQ